MSSLHWIVLAAILCVSHQSSADHVYKWIDEEGRVHYGATKPQGLSAEELKIEEPTPSDRAYAEDQRKKLDTLLKEYEQERGQRRRAREVKEARRQVQKAYCDDARRHLRFYLASRGLRLVRPDDIGELSWVSDEERQEIIEYWRDQVERLCH